MVDVPCYIVADFAIIGSEIYILLLYYYYILKYLCTNIVILVTFVIILEKGKDCLLIKSVSRRELILLGQLIRRKVREKATNNKIWSWIWHIVFFNNLDLGISRDTPKYQIYNSRWQILNVKQANNHKKCWVKLTSFLDRVFLWVMNAVILHTCLMLY